MALIIHPGQIAEISQSDGKMGSALLDAFADAAKQLYKEQSKEKNHAEDAAMPVAILVQPLVQPGSENRGSAPVSIETAEHSAVVSAGTTKIKNNILNSDVHQPVHSTDVTESVKVKKGMTLNVIASALQSSVVQQPSSALPLLVTPPESTGVIQTNVIGSASSPREKVGEMARELMRSINDDSVGNQNAKQELTNTGRVATTLSPTLSRETGEGVKQAPQFESRSESTTSVQPVRAAQVSAQSTVAATPQASTDTLDRTLSPVPRERVGERARETAVNINEDSVGNQNKKQELTNTGRVATTLSPETGEGVKQAPQFESHSEPTTSTQPVRATQASTQNTVAATPQASMDTLDRTPSPASRERARETAGNINEYSAGNQNKKQELTNTGRVATTLSREAGEGVKQAPQFESHSEFTTSAQPVRTAQTSTQNTVIATPQASTDTLDRTPSPAPRERVRETAGNINEYSVGNQNKKQELTNTSRVATTLSHSFAKYAGEGVKQAPQFESHSEFTASAQPARTAQVATSYTPAAVTPETVPAQSTTPSTSGQLISDKAVDLVKTNPSTPESDVQSVKQEVSESTFVLPTIISSGHAAQQMSPAVPQEQAATTLAATKQQAEVLVIRDKHSEVPKEIKVSYLGGELTLSAPSKTGSRTVHVSDDNIKQALMRHGEIPAGIDSVEIFKEKLAFSAPSETGGRTARAADDNLKQTLTNLGEVPAGIDSVESSIDKQPKQRQSTNQHHLDEADE